jgi:sugar lactone lactonase YvrE
VDLPISRPTGLAFGGADLKTLFVTSARLGLTDQNLDRQPMAGCLFAVEVQTPGLPLNDWGETG